MARRAMNDRSECAAVNVVFGAGASGSTSVDESVMGHLIAAVAQVEAAVCASPIRHERCRQREPARARSGLRRRRRARGAPATRADRDVQLARVRRLEQCIVLRNRRRSTAPAYGGKDRPNGAHRVTGTGAILRRRQDAAEILAASGPASRRRDDRAVGRVALAGAAPRPRSRFNGALLNDRKMFKLIDAPTFGIYAAGQGSKRRIHRASRRARSDAQAHFTTPRHLCRLGWWGLPDQYDFFRCLRLPRQSRGFGRELEGTVSRCGCWGAAETTCSATSAFARHQGSECVITITVSRLARDHRGGQARGNGECERAVAVGSRRPIEPQMVLYYHGSGC